ncbi:hypothetical protein GCM10010326_02820 [Streptomyces xanthochromogenes]|uniref:STAS domain-containing protein n=1 Tax=Streptomyces xanthochromogenes TaxID=67384 RepID=A0ABQ2ZH40_9ACTN|nr:hypothetical protein GCM10010326_02820 [Streptomyces xanthochromogenes]
MPTCEPVVANPDGAAAAISAVARAPTASAFRTRRSAVKPEFGALRVSLDLDCICYSSLVRLAAAAARARRWEWAHVPELLGICGVSRHGGALQALDGAHLEAQ